MGLDMYLYRRSYVQKFDFEPPERQTVTTVTVGGKPHPSIKSDRIAYVEEEVGYWRKANAIHGWFVNNVQGGVDECEPHRVTREQLRQLLAVCKEVLDSVETVPGEIHTGTTYYPDGRVEQHTRTGQVVAEAQQAIAEKLLPTKSWFFFGGTEYDECYLDDLKKTIEIIEPLLAEENEDERGFVYRSSW